MKTFYKNFLWWRDGQPQCMLVSDGRVELRGFSSEDLLADQTVDLGGRTLFPAFIDAHCHILPTGLDLQKVHLGACASNEDVLDLLRDRLTSVPPGKWLMAVHYDQTRYGGVYLTRDDLDKVSFTVPISLRHVSGHAAVVNSAAFAVAKVAEDVADPAGGSFGRDASGRLNGVLYERADEVVTESQAGPSLEEMASAILIAGEKMADLGISSACDMMTGRFNLLRELEAYKLAAERGCRIKTRLYLQWGEVFRRDGSWRSPEIQAAVQGYGSSNDVKISGIKIFADGAIGSATAAIYGSYASAPSSAEISGQLIYPPDRLKSMIQIADDAGYQVSVHSIGDYSTDLVLDAFAATSHPARHRIEHAMLMSDAQISRLASLGCYCVMQPEFLMRFGHSYLRQLGPERASTLKRFRSVLDAGVPLSFSSDRPIVAGDPLDGISVAVSRPEGFDPAENLSFEEAIDAYTIEAAKVTGDGALMGGLNPGQFADFRLT